MFHLLCYVKSRCTAVWTCLPDHLSTGSVPSANTVQTSMDMPNKFFFCSIMTNRTWAWNILCSIGFRNFGTRFHSFWLWPIADRGIDSAWFYRVMYVFEYWRRYLRKRRRVFFTQCVILTTFRYFFASLCLWNCVYCINVHSSKAMRRSERHWHETYVAAGGVVENTVFDIRHRDISLHRKSIYKYPWKLRYHWTPHPQKMQSVE